ncbi:MAG: GerMN domain-containing protein, partial [Patescibacteria group bacterium]
MKTKKIIIGLSILGVLFISLLILFNLKNISSNFNETEGQEKTVKVKVYFNNNIFDPEISCDKVFPVEREITKEENNMRSTIVALLDGPTEAEIEAGYYTNINGGVFINEVLIEDGMIKADFDAQLLKDVAGSCRVTAIRAQITETLRQFLKNAKVNISVDGRFEEILQ